MFVLLLDRRVLSTVGFRFNQANRIARGKIDSCRNM